MDVQSYKNLLLKQVDNVLTMTLNRPDYGNSVNATLHTELARVFLDIAEDDSIDVVVLTGAGKAFCAGGDLNWLKDIGGSELDKLFIEARQIIMRFLELEQPVIAAINGPAVGLGATLALFCDIIYAAEHAIIADPHIRVGVAAGDGGAVIWPWLVGMARAKEYLLTGDSLAATEAERIGLINHVTSIDQLMTKATSMAERLAGSSRLAIRGTKFSVNHLLKQSANVALDISAAREKECFGTPEQMAAMQAFRK